MFAEVYRVLKPGGVAIFTFSNRMFYEKVGWGPQGSSLSNHAIIPSFQ